MERPKRVNRTFERVRRLAGIIKADHVVREGNIALECEIDRKRRNGVGWLIFKSSVLPMAMRDQHGRHGALALRRQIKITAQVVSGKVFDEDHFDGVVVIPEGSDHAGAEGRLY